ncbi:MULTISPECIES: methylglyoxal synthase [Lysinibacillus]|uniref:Methylglyoxal synthase n=1 Tax=Lysinibacillus antri TaxID=2498145 RepID=A0A432LEF0_9BACI|nr:MULTISPECIES: methylglyoxal synthase [Lysinibacillus]RUL55491.1 methylglyoxal synthase [Lysinibacillus antri]TSI09055.1 methylglyoxal synthase [Lysinibacillus sp. BW-2-10]
MKIALIAHDRKKDSLVEFAIAYKDILQQHDLFATGTTGQRIQDEVGLTVTRFRSGPLGGDQQIGSMIANNDMDMVFFFRDPLTAQPHEPDVTALVRLCDVYHIPLATNMGTAEILLKGLQEGFVDWRLIQERRNS